MRKLIITLTLIVFCIATPAFAEKNIALEFAKIDYETAMAKVRLHQATFTSEKNQQNMDSYIAALRELLRAGERLEEELRLSIEAQKKALRIDL